MSSSKKSTESELRWRLATLEAELQQTKAQAQSAINAKTDFLANVGHELRTPLNAVLGFSQLLLKDQLDEKQHEKIQHIHDSAHGLLEALNDILILSKIDAGNLRPHSIGFDLAALAHSAVDQFRAPAECKHLEIACELQSGLPEIVYGDRCRLRQVLAALLGNAVKFTHEGEITLHVRSINQSDDDVMLRFDIEDSGPGIPRSLHESIFSAFTQGDGSINRQHEGIGMGLALCQRIVQMLGGEIRIQSEVGQGSTFSFLVTLHKKKIEIPSHASSEQIDYHDEQVEPFHKPRILIVDDDRLCRLLTHEMLDDVGECHLAEDGNIAVEMFAAALEGGKPYELVCLDIMMPGMDGHTALKAMRNMEERHGRSGRDGCKVVMTTALRESSHCVQSFREGCEAYVTKPIDQNHLLKTIGELGFFEQQASGVA